MELNNKALASALVAYEEAAHKDETTAGKVLALRAAILSYLAESAGWISVDERLPEPYTTVALLNETIWMNTGGEGFDTNWHGAGYLNDIGQKYWSVFGESRAMCLDAVTHWMPLPEPPK